MEKISLILQKVLENHSLKTSAKSALICEEFKRFFIKNWGEENFTDISRTKFKNGNLVVFVSNSAWSYQIYLKKNEFLELVKKMFNNVKIIDLVVKIAD